MQPQEFERLTTTNHVQDWRVPSEDPESSDGARNIRITEHLLALDDGRVVIPRVFPGL